jgi:hypothetical protein
MIDFHDLLKILRTDDTMDEMFENYGLGYIAAIYLIDYTEINLAKVKESDPARARHRDTQKISTMNKYIATELDISKDTFMESIKNNYIENECFLNSFIDFYGDNLMVKNKRNVITRSKLLQILNKNEIDIKAGLTIEEVKVLFKHFKLKMRVFDEFMNLIDSYDPEIKNFNNIPFYCLCKNNHVYTLKHDLKHLQQNMDPDDKIKISLASSNYYVKENSNYNTYMMMSGIDDIPKKCKNVIYSYRWAKLMIKLLKNKTKDDHELEIIGTMSDKLENKNTTLYFIHYNDDLMKLYLDLKDAGYDAGIKYQCGRITDIYTCFKCSYRKRNI